MLNGIDIASWQGDIDLGAIADLDFVIVKATEGMSYTNPFCDPKIQEAKSLGLKYGFYHFAGTYDPIAEADFFIRECEGYFGEGIPVLDFEADAINAWGSDGARMFLQRVYEVKGVRPLIYMSQTVIEALDWGAVAQDFGLWVACYPDVYRPDFSYDEDLGKSIEPWDFMAIWQYASDGDIEGYEGNIDVNHAFMDYEAWDKYAGDVRESGQPANVQETGQVDNVPSVTVFEDGKHKITIEEK